MKNCVKIVALFLPVNRQTTDAETTHPFREWIRLLILLVYEYSSLLRSTTGEHHRYRFYQKGRVVSTWLVPLHLLSPVFMHVKNSRTHVVLVVLE